MYDEKGKEKRFWMRWLAISYYLRPLTKYSISDDSNDVFKRHPTTNSQRVERVNQVTRTHVNKSRNRTQRRNAKTSSVQSTSTIPSRGGRS
jgi:hypothetical protein